MQNQTTEANTITREEAEQFLTEYVKVSNQQKLKQFALDTRVAQLKDQYKDELNGFATAITGLEAKLKQYAEQEKPAMEQAGQK